MQATCIPTPIIGSETVRPKDDSIKRRPPLYRYMMPHGNVGDICNKDIVRFLLFDTFIVIGFVAIVMTNKTLMEDRLGTAMSGFMIGPGVVVLACVSWSYMRRLQYDKLHAASRSRLLMSHSSQPSVLSEEQIFYQTIVEGDFLNLKLLSSEDEKAKSRGPWKRYLYEGKVGDLSTKRIVSSLAIWVASFIVGLVVVINVEECLRDRFCTAICGFVLAVWLMVGLIVFSTYWRYSFYDKCFEKSDADLVPLGPATSPKIR